MQAEENKKTEPFNHVLEVQDGEIDVKDLIAQCEKVVNKKCKEETNNGKISS